MKFKSSSQSGGFKFLAVGAVLAATVSMASAAISYTTFSGKNTPGDPFINPALGGTASTSIWYNVRSGGSVSVADGGTGVAHTGSGFPGTAPFTPIAAQVGNSSVTLSKTANGTGGGPYAAGSSIYYGGFSDAINNPGGTLSAGSTSPISGLQTIVFQVQFGEAWTYDFYNHALPVLNYTTASGAVSGVAATYSAVISKINNGTITMPSGEENLYTNAYALQWDLSGVSEPITSFGVSFQGVQHAQLYGLRLDQSTQNPGASVIPEPSAAILGAFGTLALLRRRRR